MLDFEPFPTDSTVHIERPDLRSRLADIAFYGLLISVIIIHIVINRQAGNSFPTPWPDEAHFLWQANSVAIDNTLFSEELNTNRTIMWQPPGYFVFVGMIFKITGSSLDSARMISLLLLIGAFLMLVSFITYYGHRWTALLLCSLFFLNSQFIACGNVARMEALLLFLLFAGFLLIQRGRALLGLALLAITPIVHFNGFYFFFFGLGLVASQRGLLSLVRPFTRDKIATLVVVAAAWLSYAVLIARNWESFVLDMSFQFDRKAGWNIWPFFTKSETMLFYLFMLVVLVFGLKSKIKATRLFFLAIPAWFIFHIGREMWYQVMDHTAYLLISVFTLHLWFQKVPIEGSFVQRGRQIGLAVLLLVVLIGWNYRSGRIVNMFDYQASVNFRALGLKGGAAYLTPDDQAQVAGILDSLAGERGDLLVEFQPHADALYFLDCPKNGITISCPLFEARQPDLLVIHVSRHLPSWWKFGDMALERVGLTQDSTQHILYERDQTEKWYFGFTPDEL